MSINKCLRGFGLAVAFCLAAGAAGAATLNEADAPGGAFGSAWNDLTEVGAGVTGISGTGSQNRFDNFRFTSLPKGAQTISFSFAAPEGIGHSYSAGGQILFGFEPFRHGWDGAGAGSVQVDYHRPSQSLVLNLGETFAGALYLALNFTHGADLAYTIGVPSNATAPVAPVPVPAGFLLLGSALGLAGLMGARGRRKATC